MSDHHEKAAIVSDHVDKALVSDHVEKAIMSDHGEDKGKGIMCDPFEEASTDFEGEQVISYSGVAGVELPYMECMQLTVPSSVEKRLAALSPVKTIETVETIVSTNQVSMYSYVESPKLGMVFKSFEDVETYYKEYAEQKGFGVTRVSSAFSKNKKERRGATWKCECWGPPDMRARREAKKRAKAMELCGTGGLVNGEIGEDILQRARRTSKKCECGAMLYAGIDNDGLWVIRKVKTEHDNHTPKPSDAKLVKEYRMKKYTSNVRRQLLNFYDEGVPIRQAHGCIATETGEDNLPSVKDLQHEVYKEKRLKMEGGDAAAMMAYFDKMQADNQNFYHAHRLDGEGRLKDVMWVDARSRVAYEEFGDVVCFDATYITNKYELPFANFVGVNHHGQSILLGCALVSHEDSDTFSWVFKKWLSCMGDKQPGAILTDQAAAMRKPLAEVMPNARHRWCIWHIMRKIPEKLGSCEHYADFKSPLKTLIYESFTVDEFERRWGELITTYELEDNDWLSDLYDERHMWVPAFMKEHFWAGMKTTQRVESINSFFDGFVNRKTRLYEFPEKYTRAMARRVKAENEADARCGKYRRRLVSGFHVEKFFHDIYTDTKFQEIQIECCRLMHCSGREERDLGGNIIQYLLEDRVWIIPEGKSEEVITDRRRFYSVLFNTVTKEVSCDCRKFETFGILCRHVIRVYDQNLVFDIPPKYVLRRWRKDISRKHTRVKVAYHDPTENVAVQTYNNLMAEFLPICDLASSVQDKATRDLVLQSLQQLRLEVQASIDKFLATQPCLPTMPRTLLPSSEIGSNIPQAIETHGSVSKPVEVEGYATSQTAVKDPISKKKPRGRPKGSRHKSLAETGYKKKVVKKGKTPVESQVDPTVQPPTSAKLPAKRKRNQVVQQQNTIENYYDFVEDDALVGDDMLLRNSLGWSVPSDTF